MSWVPTRALGRAALLSGLLLAAGVLLRRPDLVVLGIPFALGAAIALRRVPGAPPDIRLVATGAGPDAPAAEGDDLDVAVRVGNPGPAAYHLVVVAAAAPAAVRLPHGSRPYAVTAPAGTVSDIALRPAALRWGRHRIGPVTATALAADGLLAGRSAPAAALPVTVHPATEPFAAVDAMPQAAGLVGGHRSRRPGQGGELAGVRAFAPGDRLRRVDWRVSLRTRQLHVAATLSDRDAEVVLVLDLLTDVGGGPAGGAASAVATAVRAAAAVAEHYLHRGDRVSLVEYGGRARSLRPASGRRQFLTALDWLLDARPSSTPNAPYQMIFSHLRLASHALLVVFTPLVMPESAALLAGLVRSGRFVIAVDTLPPGHAPPVRSVWTEPAYRLWRLERDNTVGALREHGVPVVPWVGAGSLDLVLRDVSRLAAGPRGGFR
jgi:uncharacterized protein (DUF58 family)